ncbi:MAG: hypothetical protein L6416_10555 [Candidatus Omnitrophica bacterium]|nr:hypothetical protein [Candidatus Omnitrophota bacterium]
MKSLLNLVILGLFLMFSCCADAAPVGNPNFYISGDSPLNISMELDILRGGDIDFCAGNGVTAKMEYESVSSFFLKMGYLLEERNNLQTYFRLGLSEIDIVDEEGGHIDTDTDLAYGIGLSGILFQFANNVKIGADISYLKSNPEVKTYAWFNVENIGMELDYQEFEIALVISKEIGSFVPYCGIKHSKVEMEIPDNSLTYQIKMENEDNLGVFAGFDFLVREDSSLNLEGRFLDEQAFSIVFHFGF